MTASVSPAALTEQVREAVRFAADPEQADGFAALDALAEALAETQSALEMLWTYYLLPISDEQRQQVVDALTLAAGRDGGQ